MTLLDRLARAIDPEAFKHGWTDKEGFAQQDARAALEVICDALREPSGELLVVMNKELSWCDDTDPEDVLRALAAHLEQRVADHLSEGK